MMNLKVWRELGRFRLVWLGGTVSIFGTALASFALGVWVFQRTGSATEFALIAVFTAVPGILASPLAGSVADRYSRKAVIIAGDLVAATVSLAILLLLSFGRLEVWNIYALMSLTSISNAFQGLAFQTAMTQLVPRQHLARAHGLMQFGNSGARIVAPLLAGAMIGWVGVEWVLLVDFWTFLFGTSMLLLVPFPRVEGGGPHRSLFSDAAFGWHYIRERSSLVALVTYFALLNLLVGVGMILVTPMVLSFASATELGLVMSIGSAGALVGSLTLSTWGGPKRSITSLMLLTPVLGLAFLVAGLRPTVPLVAAAVFAIFFVVPMINGIYFAFWQRKVESAVQGRVFAMRRLIVQFSAPVAYLVAGPLADRIFEPLFAPDAVLAENLGFLVGGGGEGRGIGFLFLVMGVLLVLVTSISLFDRRFREIEDSLPDAEPEPAGP